MRRSLLLTLLFSMGLPMPAQNLVTVADLDQTLARIHLMPDKDAAKAIAGITLTERASADDEKRWQAEIRGERARQALTAVGDLSQFLMPPASAIPDMPAPVRAEKVRILEQMVSYVKQTLPRLPNLMAVRTTTRFEVATSMQLYVQEETSRLHQLGNREPEYQAIGTTQGQTLFFAGKWQSPVAYRDGDEVSESQTSNGRHRAQLGLETKGEFGPILINVIGDALKSSVTWSHWEQSADGRLAVFHYSVPREASHYRVQNVTDGSTDLPPYHGEIAIDPESGAIYRITISAEGSKSSAARESNILVEYGPVEIGGKTYICPLHGVAYSEPNHADAAGKMQPDDTPAKSSAHFLNDATFTQYRLFRSEVRILTDDSQH